MFVFGISCLLQEAMKRIEKEMRRYGTWKDGFQHRIVPVRNASF
jgi:hypothetical protein